MPADVPRAGRLLGVDFGRRRIGVAVSEGSVAVPLTIIEHTTRDRDVDRVLGIVVAQGAGAIVVGLPLAPDGGEGTQAKAARGFGEALACAATVPVVYHDERLSTADARAAAREAGGRGRRRLDDRAAAIILQSYLDARGHP